MYCQKCGKENNDDARFCSYCGSELEQNKSSTLKGSLVSPRRVVRQENISSIPSDPIQQEQNRVDQARPASRQTIQTIVEEKVNDNSYPNQVEPPQENHYQRPNSFHCPNCGSHNLQAVSDTTVSSQTTGGGYSGGKGCMGYLLFGPLGLLCGSCGSKAKTTTTTQTKHFWYCQDCGNKFRMPEEIKQEAEQARKTVKPLMGLGIFFAICTVFL